MRCERERGFGDGLGLDVVEGFAGSCLAFLAFLAFVS